MNIQRHQWECIFPFEMVAHGHAVEVLEETHRRQRYIPAGSLSSEKRLCAVSVEKMDYVISQLWTTHQYHRREESPANRLRFKQRGLQSPHLVLLRS